ncbi:MAG: hypothetical protein QXU20_02295 [Candidatus Woesearchaeota archaeon]
MSLEEKLYEGKYIYEPVVKIYYNENLKIGEAQRVFTDYTSYYYFFESKDFNKISEILIDLLNFVVNNPNVFGKLDVNKFYNKLAQEHILNTLKNARDIDINSSFNNENDVLINLEYGLAGKSSFFTDAFIIENLDKFYEVDLRGSIEHLEDKYKNTQFLSYEKSHLGENYESKILKLSKSRCDDKTLELKLKDGQIFKFNGDLLNLKEYKNYKDIFSIEVTGVDYGFTGEIKIEDKKIGDKEIRILSKFFGYQDYVFLLDFTKIKDPKDGSDHFIAYVNENDIPLISRKYYNDYFVNGKPPKSLELVNMIKEQLKKNFDV